MKDSLLKKVTLLLSIVLFIFSLCSCETMKAAISFKWGKSTQFEHYLEAKQPKSNIPQSHTLRPTDQEQPINIDIIPS